MDTIELKQSLISIMHDMGKIRKMIDSFPKWINISDIAEDRGMTRQAVRKQLLNGEYEPDVDFKCVGNRMYAARSVVSRIQRRRHGKK